MPGTKEQRTVRRRVMAVAVLVTAIATSAAFALRSEPTARASASDVNSVTSVSRRALPTKGIGVIRLGEPLAQASGYGRYAYVIVDRGQAKSTRRLRGTTLAYMSGTNIAHFNTGVSMSAAAAHNWLLRDSAGNLLVDRGYEGVYMGDVGSPSYQQAWVRNVLAFLRSTGIRGVFIDDVIADARNWTESQEFPATYPDQSSWAAAMASFVKAVGPELKAHGYYVLLNANGRVRDIETEDSSQYASWWRELAPYVSGFMVEYWQQNPNDITQVRSLGTAWYQQWRSWERLVSVAQRAGVDFVGLTYGTREDLQAMRFGKGSFMLDWNGKGGAFIFETADSDPYNPAWAADLGRPLRPKVEVQPGVWQRPFERGLVVVNANTAAVTVPVGGTPTTIQPTDAFFLDSPRERG